MASPRQGSSSAKTAVCAMPSRAHGHLFRPSTNCEKLSDRANPITRFSRDRRVFRQTVSQEAGSQVEAWWSGPRSWLREAAAYSTRADSSLPRSRAWSCSYIPLSIRAPARSAISAIIDVLHCIYGNNHAYDLRGLSWPWPPQLGPNPTLILVANSGFLPAPSKRYIPGLFPRGQSNRELS